MASPSEENNAEQEKDQESSGDASSGAKFSLQHKKGDLFACTETESLAHCVSEDLRMGKGIATMFKDNFGGLAELKSQAKPVGDVAVLKIGDRFIYYLITKPKAFHKPSYDSLEQSLQAMKTHCVQNGVTQLAMPKIGCGLDKLEWPKVEQQLKDVFKDTDLAITIYTL